MIIIQFYAVTYLKRCVKRALIETQVVVNAQFEDRIRARICPGDFLKRAGLFIHSLKMAKVVQMVSSSVAVLCSRVANEEATGRSLAPKWSILGAYEGFLGRGFLGKEAQNQRGEVDGQVGGASEIRTEIPASHCKAKALDS